MPRKSNIVTELVDQVVKSDKLFSSGAATVKNVLGVVNNMATPVLHFQVDHAIPDMLPLVNILHCSSVGVKIDHEIPTIVTISDMNTHAAIDISLEDTLRSSRAIINNDITSSVSVNHSVLNSLCIKKNPDTVRIHDSQITMADITVNHCTSNISLYNSNLGCLNIIAPKDTTVNYVSVCDTTLSEGMLQGNFEIVDFRKCDLSGFDLIFSNEPSLSLYRCIGNGTTIKHACRNNVFINWTSTKVYSSVIVPIDNSDFTKYEAYNPFPIDRLDDLASALLAYGVVDTGWIIDTILDDPAEPFEMM